MLRLLTAFALLSLTFVACTSEEDTSPCVHDYDQTALLTQIGEKIIVPGYTNLEQSVNDLAQAAQQFTQQPDAATLKTLRDNWLNAYLDWQHVAMFNFGPAETQLLSENINNFPVFTDRVDDAIAQNNYDLNAPTYSFTKGFPALDYLLYGEASTDNDLLANYTSDAHAATRKQFLLDVINDIRTRVSATATGWSAAGDNYINTFKTTTGVATGTPMSLLVNAWNKHYEHIKNDKIGTPVGAKTSYIPAPTKVELFYSRESLKIYIAALEASKAVFTGTTGQGLDDYLDAANAKRDGQPLSQIITDQYDLAIQTAKNLRQNHTTLYDAINNAKEAVKTAYATVQNQVINIKTDLPAVLCIDITYVDNTDDAD